jgi:hypothetical protein
VWERIMRNLKLVKEQSGLLECNTAALRKGLDEPYPCRGIAEVQLPPFTHTSSRYCVLRAKAAQGLY